MDFEYRPFNKALNTASTAPLALDDTAILTSPVAVNQNNRNTRATIAASATSPFQGNFTVFYNRYNISQFPNMSYKVPMSANDLIVKLNFITNAYDYNYTILPDDIEVVSKTMIGYRKWNYVFKAHPASISFIGQKQVTVQFEYTQAEIEATPRIIIEAFETLIAVPD